MEIQIMLSMIIIENEFHGDWKKKEEDEVKGIFKEIFAKAGFNGKQIDKMLSLF